MTRISLIKTPEQVKAEFIEKGVSVRGWALENDFNPTLVHQILSGNTKRKCARGESHKIAVTLGLKSGVIVKSIKHAI